MRKPLALLLVILLPAAGAAIGVFAAPLLARTHFAVRQADQVRRETADSGVSTTLESDAFRRSGRTLEQLYAESDRVLAQFRIGAPLLGAFAGLVFALMNVGINRDRRREIYEIDYDRCVACGRCFAFCPREQRRRNSTTESAVPPASSGDTA